MLFTWWKHLLSSSSRRPRQRTSARCRRTEIELLEERRVPAPLVALTTTNQLLAFDSSTPGTIQTVLPLTGMQSGESIVGIDVRPQSGQLYGLGSSNHLYVINTSTGALTAVGTGTFAVPLSGTAFGFSFDPVADDIRVVSDTGQNMRIDPTTGAVIDGDPNTPGIQPDANLHPAGHVVAVAYTNQVAGATSTTLLGIDSGSDMFVQIGGQGGNPSPDLGGVSPVAPIGANTSDQVGVDIDPNGNIGWAALTVNGAAQLIRVSLSTGPSPVGPIADGGVGICGLTIAALSPTGPPPTGGTTLFAVTRGDQLLTFDSGAPATMTSATAITGLQGGEIIRGVATRPATGQLYALGSTSQLYTIDPVTGAATQVGTGTFAVPLMGQAFGFSFDPVADVIRVVSDADLNMRINPDTGAVLDGNPNIPGIQPDQPLNSTYTVGAAYTNPVAGATATTLYGIDGSNGWLVRLAAPNLGQVAPVGVLGVHIDWVPVPTVGFAIAAGSGTAYAALPVNGTDSLFTIDLTTGRATPVAPIGTGTTLIVGLAAASPGRLSIASTGTSAAANAGAFQITVTRTAGTGGQVTVDFGTANGTAIAGQDYTATQGTLTFGPGETSKTITIPILNPLSQTTKTLVVGLINPTGGATLGSPSSMTLTITPGPTPNQCFVTQLYHDLLGRAVDPAGLAAWTAPLDQGIENRSQVALAIESSTEFRMRELQQIYSSLLLRPVDSGSAAVWLQLLQAGATFEQVEAAVIGSPEYYLRRGADSDAGFLSALYADVLGRSIDPVGLAIWSQALQAGESRTAVAQGVLASQESNVREVEGLYHWLLGRDADPAGLAGCVGAANSGVPDEVLASMLAGSSEYLSRAIANA
jgi:hypothetical protein